MLLWDLRQVAGNYYGYSGLFPFYVEALAYSLCLLNSTSCVNKINILTDFCLKFAFKNIAIYLFQFCVLLQGWGPCAIIIKCTQAVHSLLFICNSWTSSETSFSHWIIKAGTLAYKMKGQKCPERAQAQSTERKSWEKIWERENMPYVFLEKDAISYIVVLWLGVPSYWVREVLVHIPMHG